jgi:hypothetical protein
LKISLLFIGFTKARLRSIVSSIQEVSDLRIDTVTASGMGRSGGPCPGSHRAVFVNRDLKETRLVKVLEAGRDNPRGIPVVLVYGDEPDGRDFLYSNKYGCLLYSESDRFGRTLTASELAETLEAGSPDDELTRKLLELSLSCGPCSSG